jgi:hypothetical protein
VGDNVCSQIRKQATAEHCPSEGLEGAGRRWAQSEATAVGDASSEACYEGRGLRGLVNVGDEVGSPSAERGSMELAMEVMTAERACSQAKRRNRDLQGRV